VTEFPCGHYSAGDNCAMCSTPDTRAAVGLECRRCKTLGRQGVVTFANPDHACAACWRAAQSFGADDMDRMRVVDSRQNNERFQRRQGYMRKLEATR